MKLVCNREKLREGLAIANSVIPAKGSKPILENVCMVATDDALELLGTDMEVSLRFRIDDVQVQDPGPAVMPARVALDFVRDLSGETVRLETDENKCTITSGDDACELVIADVDEFPVIDRFEGDESVSIQGGTFTKLVGRTAFAAAHEPGRYAMHGVLTEVEGDVLRMVGTDGRRMAMATVPVDAGEIAVRPSIVPTKGLQLFCRVIADPLDQIRLSFGESQIGLRTENAEIFARLVDGEFPRYAAVIPGEITHSLEADRDLLSRKLRLVANVSGDEARAVRFKASPGQLELFGRATGRGEATAHMEIEFQGEGAEIAFNPEYVLDGLKASDLESVRLEFNERTSPGKFTLGEEYVYVVMPITVNA